MLIEDIFKLTDYYKYLKQKEEDKKKPKKVIFLIFILIFIRKRINLIQISMQEKDFFKRNE